MGTSFVAYRGRGFWSWDGYLEHLLALLASEIGPTPDEEWLAGARERWLEQSSGIYSAMIDPELDELAGDDQRGAVLLSLLDAVCRRHDVTHEVIETAGLLRELLHGDLTTTESSPLDYMVSGPQPYQRCAPK
jgi:hypothetical protein